MKSLPQLTDQERAFVREINSGLSDAEAWTRAFDPEETQGFTYEQRKTRGRALAKSRRMQAWIEFLCNATPDQLIEHLYIDQVAYGHPRDALKAADQFLESQFAGKEIAEIFLHTLKQIGAEIRIPCHERLESVKVADFAPSTVPQFVIESQRKRQS